MGLVSIGCLHADWSTTIDGDRTVIESSPCFEVNKKNSLDKISDREGGSSVSNDLTSCRNL